MENSNNKVTLGICAMAKKVNSKDMQMILNGLKPFDEFILIIFTEEIIFNQPVEEWPIVKAMIVFFSYGFPYSKVLQYIDLNNPFLINDFEMQKIFWDRRKVLKILKSNSIPTPNDIVVDRGEEINNDGSETSIELNNSQDIESMIKQYKEYYAPKDAVGTNITANINSYSPEKSSNSSKKSDNSEDANNYFIDFEESQIKDIDRLIDKDNDLNELKEYDDYIEYNGKKLNKPFVEKPCNGDDHNIYIYYPISHGGGHKKLFRKTKELCSLYFPDENQIRRNKSYIYEEFLQTDGFDIKVYTVGPEYFHAEARKSPTLDGKVQRSKEGKEIRYPINLTPEEKEYARKIVLLFKQNVCGFDILRAKGQSYICDVNGWSFVKGNKKYYEDCAILIRKLILQKINMQLYLEKPIMLDKTPKYKGMTMPKGKNNLFDEELRSVVAVFRHADRSPKQKMKLVITEPSLIVLFDKFDENSLIGDKPKEIKLTKPKELMYVLQIVKNILEIKEIDDNNFFVSNNDNLKLYQVKMVLEKNLSFEGMTRKIQLRPLKWQKIQNSKKNKITEALLIMKWGGNITHAGIEQGKLLGNTFRVEMYPSNPGDGDDLLRLHATYRHDLKCYSSEEDRCLETAAAFLQGLLQLEGHLIPIISSMVRKDDVINQFLDVSCTEIESLRKSVKIDLSNFCNSNESLAKSYYSILNKPMPKSNERKPIDDLIDQINNFYSHMQHIYNLMEFILTDLKGMLSNEEVEMECESYLIQRITSLEARNKENKDEDLKYKINNNKSVKDTHLKLASQSSFITDNRKLSNSLTNLSNTSFATNKQPILDCEEEKIVLIFKRYIKLHQDFYNKESGLFDISKIPDIYDNIKYDLLHNKNIINGKATELYQSVNLLANFVMPLEYGIRNTEKVAIGLKIIRPLLDKIRKDLIWWNQDASIKSNSQNLEHIEKSYSGLDEAKLNSNEINKSWRHVKTRFYFTSASHLYSLVNTLVYGFDSFLVNDDNNKMYNPLWNVFDLDYCSHIVFRLFENFNVALKDPKRFRIEIVMSPGTNKDPNEADKNHMLSVAPWVVLNNNLSLSDLSRYFNFCLKEN